MLTQLRVSCPSAAYCKKIRDDANDRQALEDDMFKASEFRFSHSYCPCCYESIVILEMKSLGILLPDLDKNR